MRRGVMGAGRRRNAALPLPCRPCLYSGQLERGSVRPGGGGIVGGDESLGGGCFPGQAHGGQRGGPKTSAHRASLSPAGRSQDGAGRGAAQADRGEHQKRGTYRGGEDRFLKSRHDDKMAEVDFATLSAALEWRP